MQQCRYCGADLPANARFCGKCGGVQDALVAEAPATRINFSQPQYWGTTDTPPPPPVAANEDEDRRGIPPWFPLYDAALGGDALLGSGQPSPLGPPVVQGTPQIGSVPGVAWSPTPYTNAPLGNLALEPANAAPVSYPVQAAGNAPISYPAQGPGHLPVNHSAPITHPVPEPQPEPHPPEPPGTHKHHPHHWPHRHHDHPTQDEPERLHTHSKQHEPQRAARLARVAGGSSVKTIILVVTAIVVVAAGGIAAAAHFLARPQPRISVTSSFRVGATPAGAPGTALHISGQNFSSDSAITLLLDGHAVPGNPGTRSDSNGNFSTVVPITSAWSAGAHTLTARDASNDSTQNSVAVTIVHPGQANTPGPNGAPPDDASFRLKVTAPVVAQPFSSNPVLIVTGHPDPEGGTVCSPNDSGKPITQHDTTGNGTQFTRVVTATCSGTYKAGHISYTETETSVKISFQSNGSTVHCVLPKPAVFLQLTGTYTGHNTFSGTITGFYVPYTCDQPGESFWHVASNRTWTGSIVKQ